jgi:hypothetical protein
MNDATIQKKLDQLAAIANELHAEAVKRYGRGAFVFYEGSGDFVIMDGDEEGGQKLRQDHIRFCSSVRCKMDCGAW